MLKRGLAFSIGLQAINGLSPLLLLPISLRRLGPDAYGVYVHALAISNLLAGVLVVGFAAHLSRTYLREISEGGILPFARLVAFQAMLALFASVANVVVVALFIHVDRAVYLLAILNTLFAAFNVDWYYYSRTHIEPLFWRTLVARAVIISLAAILVVDEKDLLLFTALTVVATGLANFAGFAWAWRSEKIVLRFPLREDFTSARYFFASGVIGSIQQYADQILVGAIFSKADLAHLSLCRQVVSACSGFTQAVCRVLLPRSIKELLESPGTHLTQIMRRGRVFTVGAIAVALLIATVAGPLLETLSGNKFHFASTVMLLSAACFLATSAAVYVDTQLSVPAGKEHVTTKSNVLVAATFLLGLTTMTLIPGLHYSFALLSLVLAESIGVAAMLYLHSRIGTFQKATT